MGRISVFNGNIPGSIKWDKKNIDKIVKKINIEAKKIGQVDYAYIEKIKRFINIGKEWLYTSYWE